MKITDRITKLVLARKPTIGVRSVKRDIATTCGISYEAVRQWFAGDTENIKNENLVALADGYDTTVDWLLSGKNEPPRKRDFEPVSVSRQPSSISTAEIVQVMLEKHGRELSEATRRNIVQAIEADPLVMSDTNATAQDYLSIPQYDIHGVVGRGHVPADYFPLVQSVVISENVLREKGVKYSSPAGLAILTSWDQSMEGTINDKDPVIVDRGITEFSGDGIYLLTWHDHFYIKRLQVFDADSFELISDNPKHKDRVVPKAEVSLHAKVLLVWNTQKL